MCNPNDLNLPREMQLLFQRGDLNDLNDPNDLNELNGIDKPEKPDRREKPDHVFLRKG
jgi:hypothetical protein